MENGIDETANTGFKVIVIFNGDHVGTIDLIGRCTPQALFDIVGTFAATGHKALAKGILARADADDPDVIGTQKIAGIVNHAA